jgi:hypothetical protein
MNGKKGNKLKLLREASPAKKFLGLIAMSFLPHLIIYVKLEKVLPS